MAIPFEKINDFFANAGNRPQPRKPTQLIRLKITGTKKDEAGNVTHLYLKDNSNMSIEFPMTLVKANGMTLESDQSLYFSYDMYQYHFVKKAQEDINLYATVVKKNFEAIVANSSLILNNPRYRAIRLPGFLESGASFVGGFNYSLGALLGNWINSEDLYLEKTSSYMISISASVLSGANQYQAWCPSQKRQIQGSLDRGGAKPWSHYIGLFRGLAMASKEFSPECSIACKDMLQELQIKY